METDGRYVMRNNYRYSVALLDWCQSNDVPFLYASSAAVYGGSATFPRGALVRGAAQRVRLLEVPVRSARAQALPERTAQIAGFRYFNVYGPREQHKGRGRRSRGTSASSIARTGTCRCSKARAAMATASSAATSSPSTTWSTSTSTFSTTRAQRHLQRRAAARGDVQRRRDGDRQRLPRRGRRSAAIDRGARRPRRHPLRARFPSALAGKYQSYTEADLSRLRAQAYAGADADDRGRAFRVTSNG
jgi:ADP-L-glycero-D-manno-heptose 6-epimerase